MDQFLQLQLLEVFICVTLKEPYGSSHILWKMSTLVTPNVLYCRLTNHLVKKIHVLVFNSLEES